MFDTVREHIESELGEIREAGLYKDERVITSPQRARITVGGQGGDADRSVINFCANNYLGLASDPDVVAAAKRTLDEYGFGLSSVRFICGTQTIHKDLERRLAEFLGTDDAILYSSCFDANGGLFETLLGPDDAIISDALNHASIIDGIRLCKAQRLRFAHADMGDLERCLEEAAGAQRKLIATDGVFSMDGDIAKLDEICDLAEKHSAMVMIDDCHATGFVGDTGRGTPEYRDVIGRVDIITSTLGKALGGASGGFTAARQPIVNLLRQRSRPYLFSNSVAPAIVGASLAVLSKLTESDDLRSQLRTSTAYFRSAMTEAGFDIRPGDHPIVPIMLGDAKLATAMADALLKEGVYVIGFSYPVVPKGEARIRVQISAAHTRGHLDTAIDAFVRVRDRIVGG